MSAATGNASRQAPAQAQPGQADLKKVDPGALLDEVLSRTVTEKARAINDSLEKRIERIEELLPDALKGQATRLVKRAMLTFSRKPELENCTPASFIRAVLEAAELGLAIDGRLGHAVPYKGEASFQPDYKGIIAVAKRGGQILDCYADVVCEHDQFEHGRHGADSVLEHTYDIAQPRGKVVGAYAIVRLPGGAWRSEIMSAEDVDKIKRRSKAFMNGKGPWLSDPNEMAKKTVIKRLLKTYAEDPALVRALELDDREYEDPESSDSPAKPNGVQALADKLRAARAKPGAAEFEVSRKPCPWPGMGQENQEQDHPEANPEARPPVQPDPPPPQQESGGLSDLLDDIRQAIEEAKSRKDLEKTAGKLLAKNKVSMGEQPYALAMSLFQARYTDLPEIV